MPVTEAFCRHLVRRVTYGPTRALLRDVTPGTVDAWLDAQLDPTSLDDSALDTYLARLPGLDRSIAQHVAAVDAGDDDLWTPMERLCRAAVARAAWSERQLFEVMVDFWANHFNVTCPNGDVWKSRLHYDRAVLRAGALGSFADLLQGVIEHPSMLVYLNNDQSTKTRPNENLGRELLELHTLGVDAGYTEAEVKAAARLLTGWTVDGTSGEAVYDTNRHHVGPLTIFGHTTANADPDGRAALRGLLEHLARHEATAERLATKLVRRFVSDQAQPALVASLARTYLDHDTQIVPVLRALLASDEFAASADAKVRRPFESLLATVRILGLRPETTGTTAVEAIDWMAYAMGHGAYRHAQPDGHADVSTAWQSAAGTLYRWNDTVNIVAGWWPKTFTGRDLTTLLPDGAVGSTYATVLGAMHETLLQRTMRRADITALCAFLGRGADQTVTADAELIGWRLPYVVALLLNGPAHATR